MIASLPAPPFQEESAERGHPNVLCRWCSTHLGRAINIRAKMLREQSGAEMILFVTPIINSVLEIIISAPDTIDFGFHMIDCELDTIISGLHMVIVKPSITNCVLVAVFYVTVAVLFAIVAVKSETEAVLVVVEIIISGLKMIIFALKTIKSRSEAI